MNNTIPEISKEYKRVFLKKAMKGNLAFMLIIVIVNMVIDRDFVPLSIEAVLKMFVIYISISSLITLVTYIINQPYLLLGSLNIEDDYLDKNLEYFLYKEEERTGNWRLFVNSNSSFMINFPNIYVTRNSDHLIIISSKKYLKRLQKRLEYRHKELFEINKI